MSEFENRYPESDPPPPKRKLTLGQILLRILIGILIAIGIGIVGILVLAGLVLATCALG